MSGKIAIIGDVMLDINYMCYQSSQRTAPESKTISIYNIDQTKYILGGAANVARNLASLNCNIQLFGVVGDDIHAEKLKQMLGEYHIPHQLYVDPYRPTTQKHRRFMMSELTDRFDCESTTSIPSHIENAIMEKLLYEHSQSPWEIIILSDYNKGVLTDTLCQRIIGFANENNIITFVDPKIKNYFKYKHCTFFKPNLEEGEAMTGAYFHSPWEIIHFLIKQLETSHVILTAGKDGIYLRHASENIHFSHEDMIPVTDVTGAGDIVLSILVYVFLQCYNIRIAAKIANYIGGLSVQVVGNYVVNKGLVDSLIQSPEFLFQENREISPAKQIQRNEWGKKIVFTNGCFDILHAGHIKLLNFCKEQGDIVVVGVNSDASIERLKGPQRPIQSLESRMEMLKALPMVDYVLSFEEDTPIDLIRDLSPDVLVKGGDYTIETIVGSEYAKQTMIFPYEYGKSTSNTISSVLQKMDIVSP